eukprot:6102877-Amphidinium_carterae.1
MCGKCALEHVPSAETLRDGFALELFAGAGRLSRTRRQNKVVQYVPIYATDVKYSAGHDLCSRSAWLVLKGLDHVLRCSCSHCVSSE